MPYQKELSQIWIIDADPTDSYHQKRKKEAIKSIDSILAIVSILLMDYIIALLLLLL